MCFLVNKHPKVITQGMTGATGTFCLNLSH
jgi:succinyl-CoA synthetase alpha subunit